jgi:hypothetical protein
MNFRLLLAFGCALLAGAAARADFTYQFADSTGAAANTFSVQQGATVDVRVYILATGSDTLTNNGLTAAGVTLNTTSPGVANVTAVAANTAQFNNGHSTTTGSSASVSEFASAPVTSSGTGASDRVLVGTFTFTGATVGQTLTISAVPGLSPDNVRADNSNIDTQLTNNAASAFITVTAVPEPGTLALTGTLVLGMTGAALRRIRRSAPAA